MAQVKVKLKSDEKRALLQLAERECRDPCDQAALLVRRGLERERLLARANNAPKPSADFLIRFFWVGLQIALQYGHTFSAIVLRVLRLVC